MNTGFVLFVVNYFAPKALREAVLALPGVGFLLFRGPFAELTRGWYALVGVTLVTNMVINMFVPASVTIAKLFVTSLKRWCCRGRVAHQAELIELYTNPEFDIKVKYAQLLTTIFVTLIYGSGLPLLYFLASIFMFLQFWADKYNLLWGARRPPAYDTKMAKEAIDSMFYALPLHCVLAILMFGQVCVFPSNPLGGDLGNFANQLRSWTEPIVRYALQRVYVDVRADAGSSHCALGAAPFGVDHRWKCLHGPRLPGVTLLPQVAQVLFSCGGKGGKGGPSLPWRRCKLL